MQSNTLFHSASKVSYVQPLMLVELLMAPSSPSPGPFEANETNFKGGTSEPLFDMASGFVWRLLVLIVTTRPQRPLICLRGFCNKKTASPVDALTIKRSRFVARAPIPSFMHRGTA